MFIGDPIWDSVLTPCISICEKILSWILPLELQKKNLVRGKYATRVEYLYVELLVI